MNEAIGEMLPAAVGVAISPLPIVAMVLMLVTPRGRINGPAFLLGWWIGLGIVGALALAVADGADASEDGGPADWVSWLLLALGVLLLLLALKQWRGRPQGDTEAATPKWMGALDHFSPAKALAAGVVLSAANPKNLLLTLAAAAAIAQTGISGGDEVVVYLLFVLVASLGVGIPIVIYFVLGDRSREPLDCLKTWLAAHNQAIMAVLLLVIGVKLIGNGISGL